MRARCVPATARTCWSADGTPDAATAPPDRVALSRPSIACEIITHMSQENVELVMRLQVGPEIDLAELFRSEQQWAALTASVGELFDPQCRTVAPGVPGTEPEHVGLDGLRAAWLSWLEPWLTYRAEIKQAVDGGDRVLLLTEDYGRQAGSAHEVKVDGSAVWTVGDGKIVRAEFFAHRADAFQAAGLAERGSLTDAR